MRILKRSSWSVPGVHSSRNEIIPNVVNGEQTAHDTDEKRDVLQDFDVELETDR